MHLNLTDMPNRIALVVATAALLLPYAAAHGDEHMDTSAHGAPLVKPQGAVHPSSYWSLNEHTILMYWHIGMEILAWVFVLPVGKSRGAIGCPSEYTDFGQLSC